MTEPDPFPTAHRPETIAERRTRVAGLLAALPPARPDEPAPLAGRRRQLTRRLERLSRSAGTPAQEPVGGPAIPVSVFRQARIRKLRRVLKKLGPAQPGEPAAVSQRRDRLHRRLEVLVGQPALRPLAALASAVPPAPDEPVTTPAYRRDPGTERRGQPAPPPPAVIPEAVVDLRRGDAPPPPPPRPAWPWLLGTVASVVAVFAVYWGMVATPRYEAAAGFTIRGGSTTPSLGDLSSLVGGASAGDPNRHLLAFIPSAACFAQVDAQLGLRSRWSDGRIDWISRLDPMADRERALAVWNSRVSVQLDDATGLLVLKAQGFTPEEAKATAEAVMAASQALVNELNRTQNLAKAAALDDELERSRAAIDRAVAELLAFQDRHGLADAAGAAQAISGASLGVESELVQQRAALAEVLSVMGEDADAVRRLRARIAALEREVTVARARVADSGTTAAPRLNQLAADQIRLQGMVELRQEIHRQLMATAIQARAESQHATMHLAVVAPSVLPESPSYPRFWYNLFTLTAISAMVAGIIGAMWATIRERMD
jgi:capsular polysaccharide transport system permease protein